MKKEFSHVSFTSEAVFVGHPDKCADIVADSIVDNLLQLGSDAKVATEVFIGGMHVIRGREANTAAPIDTACMKRSPQKRSNR